MKPVEALTEGEAVQELARLASEIAAHDRRYYLDEAPTVSDAQYDELKQRNAAIEAQFPGLVRPDSPSARGGAPRAETFSPVTHGTPMLSLAGATDGRVTIAIRKPDLDALVLAGAREAAAVRTALWGDCLWTSAWESGSPADGRCRQPPHSWKVR